jgi:hypothetical protein
VSLFHIGLDSYAGDHLFGDAGARAMLKDIGSAKQGLLMGGIGRCIEANSFGVDWSSISLNLAGITGIPVLLGDAGGRG